MSSPADPPNIARFLWFRIFFQARFYYPVLAILFVDLGLSMEEYTLLNVAWAWAIIVFEVPSGALADKLGRSTMVRLAAAIMVIEMALLAFAPTGNHALLVIVLLCNRILGGIAEACASGADEALAYDSLAAKGEAGRWPAILEKLMRYQSIAFVLSGLAGAALYDSAMLQRVFGNAAWTSEAHTTRYPVYLTLLSAVLAFLVSLRLKEAPVVETTKKEGISVAAAWHHVMETGRWLMHTPFALCLIAAAVLHDSVVRLFLTVESTYLRLVGIAPVWYGLIATAFSVLGFAAATPSRLLATRFSAGWNVVIHAVLTLGGLAGIALVRQPWGALFIIPMSFAFFFAAFLLSHHLNRIVDSRQRATALSFRGLSMNIAYGGAGLLFAAMVSAHREPQASGQDLHAFAEALSWLPGIYLGGLAAVGLLWRIKRPADSKQSNT